MPATMLSIGVRVLHPFKHFYCSRELTNAIKIFGEPLYRVSIRVYSTGPRFLWMIDYQQFASENPEQLARAIERGIPDTLRGMMWLVYLCICETSALLTSAAQAINVVLLLVYFLIRGSNFRM